MYGQIAQQENGAVIVFEHRFFGFSNPLPDLTTESLSLLTLEQSIEDIVYLAENINLPMTGGDSVKPDTNPWILAGGSYSGTGQSLVTAKHSNKHHRCPYCLGQG